MGKCVKACGGHGTVWLCNFSSQLTVCYNCTVLPASLLHMVIYEFTNKYGFYVPFIVHQSGVQHCGQPLILYDGYCYLTVI